MLLATRTKGAAMSATASAGPTTRPPAPDVFPPRRPRLVDAHESLLVVDDDDGIRRMLALLLARRTSPTAVASSVSEAIELLEREPFDVVVSDYSMPQANGLDLLAYVGARGLDVRFALASAAFPDGVEELARAGGAEIVDKDALVDALVFERSERA
jgi:DNA-binding NtrC family response regulator